MTLEEFGNELKKARLGKNISLNDIANATRINSKFLEALEQGKFDILPATYIRAFLREYAQYIGLSPDEVLKQYSDILNPGTEKAAQPNSSEPASSNETRIPLIKHPKSTIMMSEYRYVIALSVLIITIIGWLFYRSAPKPTELETQEIPFEEIIKDTELKTTKKPVTVVSKETPLAPVVSDSLVLEITTTDSVWISILIDNTTTKEFLFPPNTRRTLKAATQFSVTVGNASAATFRLNGKDLGMLGKAGSVVRNKLLTVQTNKKQ